MKLSQNDETCWERSVHHQHELAESKEDSFLDTEVIIEREIITSKRLCLYKKRHKAELQICAN